MKYALDVLDRANIYGIGTVLENNPTFRVFLDETIDEDKLKNALYSVFARLPYMKSRLFYDVGNGSDGRYCLLENTADFPINHCRFEQRPMKFGRETNGYMFQISYYENELIFDWSHIATDGLGFLLFMREVLAAYYGIALKYGPEIYENLPVSENYDTDAKKSYLKPQADGFDQDRIAHSSPKGTAHCTTLCVPAEQVLTYRKRVDATPAAIVSALIAKTFRNHLKNSGTSGNDNVKGKIVVTTRKPLEVTTLHNCYLNLFVSYTDAFDKFDFSTVCTIFRAYIDLAIQKESVLNDVRLQTESILKTERNTDLEAVFAEAKAQAIKKRKNYCNFNFSYLGVLPFEPEIMEHIKDFKAICFNENSEFGVFAYSFTDKLYLTICENYTGSDIVSEFMKLSRELGICFEKVSEMRYTQAYFELPD